MKHLSIGRRVLAALALVGLVAAPAAAQEQAGERYTILVPYLAPQDGANGRFGENVAKELRKLIEDSHTHQTVSDRELRDARRQYNLDEEQLYNCVTARQLAMQKNWQLVVCGDYRPAGDRQMAVSARFIGSQSAEEFEVPSFTASERDARQAAQQILQSFDRYTQQLSRTVWCKQYLDSQQYDQALENCNVALEINPNAVSALYQKAYVLYEMDRHAESLEALERLLELDPIRQDALKLAGIVATEAGESERARGYFDTYMELNPGDVGVLLSIATDMSNAGDPEGALRLVQPALENEPDNLRLPEYAGHFAVNAASRIESAMQNGGEAADPAKVTELYEVAADAYTKVFEAQGAETDPSILERLVIAQFKLGRYDEAVALGQRATEAQPENAAIWEAYSRALEQAGQSAEALAALEQASRLGSTSPALVQRAAALQLKQGNTAGAVSALQQAVEGGTMQPKDAFATIFREAYVENYQNGRLDQAYALLDEAGPLAVREEDKLTRNFWRGYILYEQGRKANEPMTAESARRAKPLFERALQLLQAAQGYEKIHASADVPKLIEATQQLIAIQDALIRRGR